MHPFFIRLGIGPEVYAFFRPFFTVDEIGNLVFSYGEDSEHYGLGFHRIPSSGGLWLAGNLNFPQVRFVILCGSAMDAVAWLKKKLRSFTNLEEVLFIATGAGLNQSQLEWIVTHFIHKEFSMIYGRDLLGKITALKMAAAIRRVPGEIYLAGDSRICIHFRARNFSFSREAFSLNAFEKASGYRFHIPASQPRFHDTFFDELKASAHLTI